MMVKTFVLVGSVSVQAWDKLACPANQVIPESDSWLSCGHPNEACFDRKYCCCKSGFKWSGNGDTCSQCNLEGLVSGCEDYNDEKCTGKWLEEWTGNCPTHPGKDHMVGTCWITKTCDDAHAVCCTEHCHCIGGYSAVDNPEILGNPQRCAPGETVTKIAKQLDQVKLELCDSDCGPHWYLAIDQVQVKLHGKTQDVGNEDEVGVEVLIRNKGCGNQQKYEGTYECCDSVATGAKRFKANDSHTLPFPEADVQIPVIHSSTWGPSYRNFGVRVTELDMLFNDATTYTMVTEKKMEEIVKLFSKDPAITSIPVTRMLSLDKDAFGKFVETSRKAVELYADDCKQFGLSLAHTALSLLCLIVKEELCYNPLDIVYSKAGSRVAKALSGIQKDLVSQATEMMAEEGTKAAADAMGPLFADMANFQFCPFFEVFGDGYEILEEYINENNAHAIGGEEATKSAIFELSIQISKYKANGPSIYDTPCHMSIHPEKAVADHSALESGDAKTMHISLLLLLSLVVEHPR